MALGLLEDGGEVGVLVADEELPPSFSPTPRPITPKAMAMMSIVAQDRIQNHFERRETHDGTMVAGFERKRRDRARARARWSCRQQNNVVVICENNFAR